MVKKGDTLIEVTIAIGIFSLIAISISAVLSSGTSGAQTALETTLTREEIDTQAEALRFIHTAYASDKDAASGYYPQLWEKITENAIDLSGRSDPEKAEITQFAPTSCSEIYDTSSSGVKSEIDKASFVINPRNLGNTSGTVNNWINSVYIRRDGSTSSKFTAASIYPRLIYGNRNNNNASGDLISEFESDINYSSELFRAEGIYVIAVKDVGTTNVVEEPLASRSDASAFYDFYIRTCWYGTDATEASTVSTVIRLYDPNAIKVLARTSGNDDSGSQPEAPVTVSLSQAYASAGKSKYLGYYKMQDMDSDICSRVTNGQKTTLIDVRNNATYSIAKINNNCWMTQNLRITGNIPQVNSNFSSRVSVNVHTNDLTEGNSLNEPRSHDSGNPTIGVWYNYAAATANTIIGTSNSSSSTQDICPAGWSLPSESQFSSIADSMGDFSLMQRGFYYSGIYSGDTSNSFWWSSSPHTVDSGDMRFSLSSSGRTVNEYRVYGDFIRCVSK